ncbi:MAG: hypothetical protein GX033_05905 [Firmicutes bacterium]|nr:hypothetical protein [Bacillota bacterium]
MRRSLAIVCLALLMLVLTGCDGSLYVDMETRLQNSEGKGELLVTVSGTGDVNEALKNGDFSEYFSRVEAEGFFVRQYAEGDMGVIEIGGSFESLESLNTLQADLLAPLKLAPIIRAETLPGLFSSRNIFDVTFKNLDGEEEASIPTFFSGQQPPADVVPDTFVTYRLTTPGKIVSSNALQVEKNSAVWTLSDTQIQSGISLGVLSQQWQYGRIAGAALLLVLVVISLYRWLFM